MSIHTDVNQVRKFWAKDLSAPDLSWTMLGWGLCLVLLLGFSPRLFHFQEYLFFILIGIGVLLSWQTGKSLWIHTPITTPFLCLVVWIALTIPFSIDPWSSLKEWQKVAAQFVVFYGTCLIVKEQTESGFRQMILMTISVGTILCCSYSLFDFWERGGNIWDRNVRAGFPLSSGADFTWLSTNVLIVLPVLAAGLLVMESFLIRLLLACAAWFALLGLIFSYSRGAWLGFFAQIVLACWFFNKKVAYGIFGFGLLLFTVLIFLLPSTGLHQDTLDTWTIKSRLAVWEMSLSDILAHPLTGVGYGVSIFEQQHQGHIAELEATESGIPDIPEKPHNWYLMVAMGTGLPGLLLFIWLLGTVWIVVWHGFHDASTEAQRYWILGTLLMSTGFYVRIFFDDSFGGSHSYLFWILLTLSSLPFKNREGFQAESLKA